MVFHSKVVFKPRFNCFSVDNQNEKLIDRFRAIIRIRPLVTVRIHPLVTDLGQTVQPGERKQTNPRTDGRTDATKCIISLLR